LLSLVLATTQGGLSEPEYVVARERTIPAPIRGLPIELREVGPSYRAENPEGVARWLEIEHSAGAARPRQSLSTQITYAALQALDVPTLLIAAGADLLAPPALMRLIAKHIRGSEFSVIAEAGHSAHWERPDEWNAIVFAWLAARGPA
jgi:pimeloyl-ACP methyl ester carboxylesterase